MLKHDIEMLEEYKVECYDEAAEKQFWDQVER